MYGSQKLCEDFAKFCGLLRIYELYLDKVGKPNSFGAVPEVARQSVIYARMKTLKL